MKADKQVARKVVRMSALTQHRCCEITAKTEANLRTTMPWRLRCTI